MLSATVLWLASGLLSPAPEVVRHVAAVLCALLCVLRDTGAVRLPLPQNARQIPQEVLQRHLLRGTLQFGFELGTGVRTYVTASAPYALAAGLLLWGGLGTALLAGAGFAAGRALTPVLRLLSGDVTDWDVRLEDRRRALKVTTSVTVLLAVLALTVVTWP
ncbi:hypothetical protein RM572_02120 [Streptomyces sp. DSM 42041]|uniref:Uncharacterized protein n=1 Tax=Streptomyces hazeniae TaxID=3075538 RepID=A0ABU2NKR0_9ACTN|nr:hypothetical protein [Streptomyces sp. DSM 42041]MDT0377570.1 hypothetical protein [Streptomyces sp. DSM 42041]